MPRRGHPYPPLFFVGPQANTATEGDAEKTVKKAQVTKTKTPVALRLTTTEEQLGVQKLPIPMSN